MNVGKKLKEIYFGNLPEVCRAFPYFGTKIYFPRKSLIFKIACESGIYESDNLRVLQALAEDHSTVFDIGANIGLMAVPLLATLKQLHVYSIEPSPNSLPYLLRTAQGSKYGSRWKIIGKAVGNALGTIEFHLATKEQGAFDGIRNTGRTSNNGIIQVPMTTLDHEWIAAGEPRVSVIKIDVEGAEKMVLEGGSMCISKNRPSMLIEWNLSNLSAFGCDPEWLFFFAKNSDYNVYAVPGVSPINNSLALKAQMALSESFLLLPN